ncbi:unnamed protein product [Discosporangium mesarthrocarpum]
MVARVQALSGSAGGDGDGGEARAGERGDDCIANEEVRGGDGMVSVALVSGQGEEGEAQGVGAGGKGPPGNCSGSDAFRAGATARGGVGTRAGHLEGGSEAVDDVEPVGDRLVLFRSDLVVNERLPVTGPDQFAVVFWMHGAKGEEAPATGAGVGRTVGGAVEGGAG